jgi:hypothetical protein
VNCRLSRPDCGQAESIFFKPMTSFCAHERPFE